MTQSWPLMALRRGSEPRRYWSKLPMSLPSETIMQWLSMVNTWYMGYGHLTIEDSVQCDIIGKKRPYHCGYNHSLLWGSKPCFDHGTFVLLNVDNVELLYADQERAKKKGRKGRKNHTHSDSVTHRRNKQIPRPVPAQTLASQSVPFDRSWIPSAHRAGQYHTCKICTQSLVGWDFYGTILYSISNFSLI